MIPEQDLIVYRFVLVVVPVKWVVDSCLSLRYICGEYHKHKVMAVIKEIVVPKNVDDLSTNTFQVHVLSSP